MWYILNLCDGMLTYLYLQGGTFLLAQFRARDQICFYPGVSIKGSFCDSKPHQNMKNNNKQTKQTKNLKLFLPVEAAH